MTTHVRRLVWAWMLVSVVSATQSLQAQLELGYTLKYSSGQDIQPIFEGWSRNRDGGFAMHFGYLNRNFVEELHIPIGPENRIEPGGPDRGQPTFFYTRINRNLFTVTVPADWGSKELVWTVTVRGRPQRAIAWLQPEWEIDPAGGASSGGRTAEDRLRNTAPTITVRAVPPITLSENFAWLDFLRRHDQRPYPRRRTTTLPSPASATMPPVIPAPRLRPCGPSTLGPYETVRIEAG